MRRLPTKVNGKQNIIIKATYDYYGPSITTSEKSKAKQVALYLMGKRRGVNLDDEQKSVVWAVRENLKDEVCINQLVSV
jgi:hypothetical protein